MGVSRQSAKGGPSSSGPSIWWLLSLALALVVLLWGASELLLASSIKPVALVLLLALVGLPLMVLRRQWWRPQRRGINVRLIYALLVAGLSFIVLGGVTDALLTQQMPRLFLYPNLLALVGVALLVWRHQGVDH